MEIDEAAPRNAIWRELHARPYVRFTAPAHVLHFAFLTGEGNEAADHARLDQLKRSLNLETTYETVRPAIGTTVIPDLGRLVMAWERHTEYVACTFFVYELAVPFQPFGLNPDAFLPVDEMDALRAADSLEKERAVLNSLLELAADVEHVRARVFNRFAASSAYFAILKSRLRELREQKIEHVLRLSRFLMRRLAPAARTLRSVHSRLTHLSERIDRGADLLRTRIDLTMEAQNQKLLASVDRRARLQLGLQHAVEGLSIIVLTYYTLGILGHILNGADEMGWHVRPEITLGIAAPIVLLTFFGLTRLIRRGFDDH